MCIFDRIKFKVVASVYRAGEKWGAFNCSVYLMFVSSVWLDGVECLTVYTASMVEYTYTANLERFDIHKQQVTALII